MPRPHRYEDRPHRSHHVSNRHSSSDETLVADDRRTKDAERREDTYIKEIHILKSEKASVEAQLRIAKRERDEALKDKREKDYTISNLKTKLQLAQRTNHSSLNDDYSRSVEPRPRASRRPPDVRFEDVPAIGASSYRTGTNAGDYLPIPVRKTRLN